MGFKRTAKRINFANGNWIDVSPVNSAINDVNHRHRVIGKHTNLRPLLDSEGNQVYDANGKVQMVAEIDTVLWNLSYCKERIIDWYWIEDGEEVPFSKDAIDELPELVIDKVYSFIKTLDNAYKAALGTDDPNG